ncbi:hypothetical protein ACLMJK_006070 [Lecanora helva]
MVPPEHIRWFSDLPSSIASAHLPLRETVGMSYLVPAMDAKHDMYIMDVVRKDMTRNLGKLQSDIIVDLKGTIDRLLGMDQETWRQVRLYDIMQETLFKSSNRVFVGMPLCQNDVFLRSVATFANLLGVGAVIVGELMPHVFKPFFGYLLAIPIYLAQAVALRYLVPEVKQRMAYIQRKNPDPSYGSEEPKDMLMWIVIAAMQRGDPNADQPEKIAQGLLFLMLGGIHTSILTTVNVLLDLLSSPAEFAYYDRLREEVDNVFGSQQDWEAHASLAKLVRADSAIRESLRMNPVIAKTGFREVVEKNGLDLPEGQKVPRGAWLAIPSVGVHYDEKFYPRAGRYEPFRFVPKVTKDPVEYESTVSRQRKHQGLASASEIYLAFGFGRHSCPGRWFVALELKLLLAYIVSHYDFEPLEYRPRNRTFGGHLIPPSVTVKVRRRKGH